MERVNYEVEYWGGWRYLGVLAIGAGLVVLSVWGRRYGLGPLAFGMGSVIIFAARGWRQWRDTFL